MSCPRPGKECNEFMCGSSIEGVCGGLKNNTPSKKDKKTKNYELIKLSEIEKIFDEEPTYYDVLNDRYDIREKIRKLKRININIE